MPSSKRIKYDGIPLLIASLEANSKDEGLYLANYSPMAEQGLTSDYDSNVAEFSFHAGVMSDVRDRCKPERLSH
tara:strand:+ start:351 stop:572 length:222 start_codon:yes stop_codon:yes gene_type:complete